MARVCRISTTPAESSATVAVLDRPLPALGLRLPSGPGAPVVPGPGRGGTTLALVSRAVHGRTIWVLSWRRQPEDAQLADLHARPQGHRQIGHIGQFERHVPGVPRIDE